MRKTLSSIVLGSLFISTSAMADSKAQTRLNLDSANLAQYEHKIGDLYYNSDFRTTIGYDDNSSYGTSSSSRREGGFAEIGFGFDFYKEIFAGLALDSDLTIGYRQDLGGSHDQGGLILTSDSGAGAQLGLDWDINETTKLSFIETASVDVANIYDDNTANKGSDEKRYWKNEAALLLQREICEYSNFAIQLGRTDYIALENSKEPREYEEYYASAKYNWFANESTTISPYVDFSDREWKNDENALGEKTNNDFHVIEYGIETQYHATDQLSVNAFVAYQDFSFSSNQQSNLAAAGTTPEDNKHDFSGGIKFTHLVNENFNHEVGYEFGSRATGISDANVSEYNEFNYTASYNFNSDLSTSAVIRWQDIEEDVTGGQKYEIISPQLIVDYKLSERQGLKFSYIYNDKESDTAGNDYDQSKFKIQYRYQF